jgi:glycosyltransferase involved in cell wall biosynthesis
MPAASLIISTYNRPGALRLTLQSVLQQVKLPAEIIIADDGSASDTKELINQFANKFTVPLKHIWQADNGFRLAGIRNKSIAAASYEYIIQIDGDLILHSKFVHDHIKFAKENSFVTASRVLLNQQQTEILIDNGSINVNLFSSYTSDKGNGLRMPFLWKYFEAYKRNKEKAKVRGCNMAFFKKDFINVNGYDESFTGWGHEDMELAARFLNNGLLKRFLKFGGIQYHLYHPEAAKDNDKSNKEKVFETERTGKKKCDNGVDKYLDNQHSVLL